MKSLILVTSALVAFGSGLFAQTTGDLRLPVYLEQDSVYTEIKIPFVSYGTELTWDGMFPSYGALHHTSKFAGSVSSQGILGASFSDPLTGESAPGFEFPYGSGITYLCKGGLWVGGIIGSDTLVSVATSTEIEVSDGLPSIYTLNELFPTSAYSSMRSIEPIPPDTSNCFRAHFVDTFTLGLPNLNPPTGAPDHSPMNLSIVQKSYSKNDYPYRNLLLLDYTITNIGQTLIKNAYTGLYVDGDVLESYDDLAGSFRDLSTAYIFDSDANLINGSFGSSNPTAAMGIRPVFAYPPVTDTNFNWWGSYFPTDFGPRRQPTELDPFRDFGNGLIGTPTGDGNKYYIMSHPEWDYDQVMTTLEPYGDDEWLDPDIFEAMDYANGKDTRILMSIGPVDLMPDSSIRAVFALFAGELVHIDPANIYRLAEGDYSGYYDGLFFDIFRANAERARWFAEEVLDPTRPPTGLRSTQTRENEIALTWDRWVLPEVLGYNLYFEQLAGLQPSNPVYDKTGTTSSLSESSIIFVPAGENSITISGLVPGNTYVAYISHVGDFGEGQPSLPITIEIPGLSAVPEAVTLESELITYETGASSIELCWVANDTDDIDHYNVYKSLELSGTSPAPDLYDSVSAGSRCYTDTILVDGAYYRVTAVSKNGLESAFSDPVRSTALAARASKLRQNYPNPFNASTAIYYELNNPGRVTLEIFNILGQSVHKLVNEENQPAGTYNVVWDGTDEHGQVVSTGMYFYRLVTDEQIVCKKMLLLK